MRPAARWALSAYPPSFRERYGAELEALVEDLRPSWRHTAGLYVGAARAWVRPSFVGPEPTRRRLLASVTTVWVAWCVGFLLVPAIDKALLDPPGAGTDPAVRRLLDASAGFLVVGWLVALFGATLLASRTLVPALRERGWSTLRPLLPVAVLGVALVAGLAALARATSGDSRPTTAAVALASVWTLGLVAFLVSGGLGPGVVLRRLAPDTDALRVPTALSAALALCLVGLTATGIAAAVLAGDAALVGSVVPVIAVLAVGGLASSTAVVSAARGVLALRRPA